MHPRTYEGRNCACSNSAVKRCQNYPRQHRRVNVPNTVVNTRAQSSLAEELCQPRWGAGRVYWLTRQQTTLHESQCPELPQPYAEQSCLPVGIQVTIQQDPLGVVIRLIGQLSHIVRQQPILPFTGGHVYISIQLLSADTLGVQVPDGDLHGQLKQYQRHVLMGRYRAEVWQYIRHLADALVLGVWTLM